LVFQRGSCPGLEEDASKRGLAHPASDATIVWQRPLRPGASLLTRRDRAGARIHDLLAPAARIRALLAAKGLGTSGDGTALPVDHGNQRASPRRHDSRRDGTVQDGLSFGIAAGSDSQPRQVAQTAWMLPPGPGLGIGGGELPVGVVRSAAPVMKKEGDEEPTEHHVRYPILRDRPPSHASRSSAKTRLESSPNLISADARRKERSRARGARRPSQRGAPQATFVAGTLVRASTIGATSIQSSWPINYTTITVSAVWLKKLAKPRL
jgi:hypothetical protein